MTEDVEGARESYGIAGAMLAPVEMGLGAGGRMEQQIYPDPHGWEVWDNGRFGRVYAHIVNSLLFHEITDRRPPASPISARTYTEYGYPWFDLYDEHLGDVETSDVLAGVRSISELDAEQDDPVFVPGEQVVTRPVASPPGFVADGDWPR
jgi:hypothetical protein